MVSPDSTQFNTLLQLSKKRKTLDSIAYLLEWDQETFMPTQSADFRGQQLKLMASLIHEQKTSKDFQEALSFFIDIDTGELKHSLDLKQASMIRNWHKDFKEAILLPNEFVQTYAEVTSKAIHVWAQARKENNFMLFYPHFQKVIDLSCQKADYLKTAQTPYDTLLDLFEPEMTSAQLDQLFNPLKEELQKLLKVGKERQFDQSCLGVKFPEDQQLNFGKMLLQKMGCDPSLSRLDLSTHPFSTTLHLTDTRMTTRIDPNNFWECLSAVMHEGGHSLYETHFSPEFWGSPLSEAASFGIHESQSRFWETIIGQSYAFWEGFYPALLHFCPALQQTSLNTFYEAINMVKPGLIRIQADEVSYCLHVFIRYEIEKGLINRTLQPKEVPDLWNSLYKKYLDVAVPSDSLGCLQDIHWSMGGFGYFPTYALGNIFAGSFFETLKKQLPDYEKILQNQQLDKITLWLKKNIHEHGRTYSPKDLVEKVTGNPLTTADYIGYLNQKYKALFALSKS